MCYNQMVDWFSFGCVVAEFISGKNPFRTETALNFGMEKEKKTKEKAIDFATLEMKPELKPKYFSGFSSDFCTRLLDKNPQTRLGSGGIEEIMDHKMFEGLNWEMIISDRKVPPFIPAKDVNAASQSDIGTFAEEKNNDTASNDKDDSVYQNWDWTNPKAYAAEVIEFLIYERETGEPLLPPSHGDGCCCTIL
uniref:AGC-kinase C-terminal domain-containing protein n=1 Tax=Eucampia antarctica TaxID=49252 RepID=A0A7S2WKG5_9STRA|mmetsp:Transcript_4922/g.4630  ORF Transcript_4922/g.4630 Transcript_4922/m.4630 type:complete len:193 (+) Transcript_4922:2-580(+)